MKSCDVSSFAQPSLPILVIALCFVEFKRGLSDCNESKAKEIKMMKMTWELSTTTVRRI